MKEPDGAVSTRRIDVRSLGLIDLLHQVILDTHLLDLIELRFEPVDVLLLILEDRFEQLTGAVVAQLGSRRRARGSYLAHSTLRDGFPMRTRIR